MASKSQVEGKRRLGAILFADVAGYAWLMGQDETTTHRAVMECFEQFEVSLEGRSGAILNTMGDGLLVFFDSVVDAVRYAQDVQSKLSGRRVLDQSAKDLLFRIGINLGDVIIDNEQVYGESVNVAERLEGLARPGGICISKAVYDQIKNKLYCGYEYLGPQSLKNIDEPVEAFLLREAEGGAVLTPSIRPLRPRQDRIDQHEIWPWVVVLPFASLGGDAGDALFADGLTEDITTNLSRFRSLRVIARGSAFLYKGKSFSVGEIGRQLGVRYVVSGSVRLAASRLRVAVQLIEAESGRTIWAERYNRTVEDIFDILDEITEIAVGTMAAQIEAAERERLRHATPANLLAYGLLLEGQQRLFCFNRDDNTRARHFYERALESDPDYARALAAISRTYNYDWRYSWSNDPSTSLDRALQMAERAIALDPADARGYGELGFVQLYRKRHESSLAAYARALTLNPNDADIMAEMGDVLAHSGQSEQAVELLQKAMRLNPYYPDHYLWKLSGAYFNLESYEDAIRTVRQMNNPNEGRRVLAASYALMGKLDDARFHAQKLMEVHPNFSLKHWRRILPDKNPEETERFVEGLRRSGLS